MKIEMIIYFDNSQPTQAIGDQEQMATEVEDPPTEEDSKGPAGKDTLGQETPADLSANSSTASSVSPTLPPPPLFVNALNLQPNTTTTNTTAATKATTST